MLRVKDVVVQANDALQGALSDLAERWPEKGAPKSGWVDLRQFFCGSAAQQHLATFRSLVRANYGEKVKASYEVLSEEGPFAVDDRWKLVQVERWSYSGELRDEPNELRRYTYWIRTGLASEGLPFCIDDYISVRESTSK